MIRTRLASVALAAGLTLLGGCSSSSGRFSLFNHHGTESCPNGCNGNGCEVDASSAFEGPVLAPAPETIPVPTVVPGETAPPYLATPRLVPTPQPAPGLYPPQSAPMPYTPAPYPPQSAPMPYTPAH